jgi:hypothetical protein
MKRRICGFVMLAYLVFISVSGTVGATAQSLSSPEQKAIWAEEIEEFIWSKYGDIYAFDNFDFSYTNERIENGSGWIDINVIVDMTLIRHPSDSPFVLGMEAELALIDDPARANEIQEEIDNYINETSAYYNVPDSTGFQYTIEFPVVTAFSIGNSPEPEQLYHRETFLENEYAISPVSPDETIEIPEVSEAMGREAVIQFEVQMNNYTPFVMSANWTYDRLDARDYALDHGTDMPEFYEDGHSDCANFVSKAINAGGIPTQNGSGTANKWYPATTFGNVGTASLNWIRTGSNGTNGVTIYMVNKGYFYEQANTGLVYAGSIAYKTTSSHVALVTYGDGSVIKITDHSDYQKSQSDVNRVWSASTFPAEFYMPSSSIM